ncbi:MAG TPA: AraC family transcriptional regulator [Verrucomicrobiae bacterium]|jgi:AraC family transcriptional regulator of arabinose operon|nr:AraC family transcriptional regulator [Verrucomicrobiae bacterium]
MSISVLRKRNHGCYTIPFSGVGMEFFPLGMLPDQSGVLLHETGYLARNDWWDFPNTLSPFWRLYFNTRPGHKVVFPNAEFDLTPERIVLVPDHQLFHSVGRTPVPHCWMTFQVGGRLAHTQSIPILLRPSRIERQLLDQIMREFTGIGMGNRNRILHFSLALLHLVLSNREILWQASRPSEALLRTLRYIETNHASTLESNEMAAKAGLSVRGFSKAFKRHQGVTPCQFLTQVRVREAAQLLASTDISLEQIAEKTGFPNRHYLSRVFKKITGDSPAHFRHRQGNTPPGGE